MSFVSTRTALFQYLDQRLGKPSWEGKRILDFGGNYGVLLRDAGSAIELDKYWCIDVSRDAVRVGAEAFPEAHFIFYDRYSFEYNPRGVKGLAIPDLGERFDFILAYSVFTHTSKSEMIEQVGQLFSFLRPGGTLAFTFLDPKWEPSEAYPYPGSNLKWRLKKKKDLNPAVDVNALLKQAEGADWVTFVNDDELYINGAEGKDQYPTDSNTYITFCDPAHMKAIFPRAQILPPAPPERHHLCLLKMPSD